MSCDGQCIRVYWKAVSVANFKALLTTGDPAICKADNQILIDWLLTEATSAATKAAGSSLRTRIDCDDYDCDCGYATAKDEIVLTKVYPYSTTYTQVTITKVGGKIVGERTCEWTLSGDVTVEKHRVTAECSPLKIQPPPKKYYFVKYEGQEAVVGVPPGDDWAEAIAAALSKTGVG